MLARGFRTALLLLATWLPAARALAAYGSCGDATGDGVVDVGDAVRVLRTSVGLEPSDEAAVYRADVAPATVIDEWQGLAAIHPSGDGALGISDAVLLLRAGVGLVSIDGCAGYPRITTVSPSLICAGGGLHVEILGQNLIGGSTRAWLGDSEAAIVGTSVDRWGQDHLDVVTPDLSDGGVWLHVVTARGLATDDTRSFLAVGDGCHGQPPLPTGIVPAWGVAGSETLLEIAGGYLGCARAVRAVAANGRAIEAHDVRTLADWQLVAVLPPAASPGTYTIVITTDCGEGSLGGWSFRDGSVPDALTIAPSSSIAADGGDTLLIRGTGLAEVTSIDFAGIAVTDFVVSSDSELSLRAPANPAGAFVTTPGAITVRRGSVVDPTPIPFTWAAVVLATCTRLLPAYDSLRWPGSINIEGTRLDRIDEVRFGGVPGTRFEQGASSSGDITVEPPVSLGPGRYAVELVRHGNVETSCAGTFEWRP